MHIAFIQGLTQWLLQILHMTPQFCQYAMWRAKNGTTAKPVATQILIMIDNLIK